MTMHGFTKLPRNAGPRAGALLAIEDIRRLVAAELADLQRRQRLAQLANQFSLSLTLSAQMAVCIRLQEALTGFHKEWEDYGMSVTDLSNRS